MFGLQRLFLFLGGLLQALQSINFAGIVTSFFTSALDQSTPAPTPAPVAPLTFTSPPTSADSERTQATPYALLYTLQSFRVPKEEEIAEVAELTRVYLEETAIAQFAQTSIITLDDFLNVQVGFNFEFQQPVRIEYQATALFNPSSILIPPTSEIDDLIEGAFTDEGLGIYLARLQALPISNLFSTSATVSQILLEVMDTPTKAPVPQMTISTLPTRAPVGPASITPPPTSAASERTQATPYALLYSISQFQFPSDDDINEVVELTRVYLEEVAIAQFAQTSIINLDDFLNVKTNTLFGFGQPFRIDYQATALFNPSSILIPPTSEIDDLIEGAFTGEGLGIYLARVQALPDNIFNTASGIVQESS